MWLDFIPNQVFLLLLHKQYQAVCPHNILSAQKNAETSSQSTLRLFYHSESDSLFRFNAAQ